MIDFIKKRLNLAITLVLLVFCVMVATFVVATAMIVLLHRLGLITFSFRAAQEAGKSGNPFLALFMLFGICILIGTVITAFLSKKTLNPINKVIAATHRVAQGDFSVRVDVGGIEELEELSRSFNKMAQELASIETLRSDFVNNFSHEFKTPIVSIRGFAKLLKENENLTPSERSEYLDIILTESQRLADLSTHVLNLTKYESIEIVADKKLYRLDEQIRRTVVLLEPRWSAKDITVNVDLEKADYLGNEDLTQQIWLNLLDNAVKFSFPGGTIHLLLTCEKDGIRFVIRDDGPGMNETTKAHIFDRFFQGDASHKIPGNGLGLAIVKRIVNLCGGRIEVQSEPGKGSSFEVFLPNP